MNDQKAGVNPIGWVNGVSKALGQLYLGGTDFTPKKTKADK
jgi:hypothetical protein